MRAYLIDPEARVTTEIDLPEGSMLAAAMRSIIGAPSGGMDHQTISDMHDSIWVDEFGLLRGEPIHAFKLPIQRDPYAGRAIIIGADDQGCTRAPFIPIELLACDIEWLGVIVPAVEWIEEANGGRAVVTWSRPSA